MPDTTTTPRQDTATPELAAFPTDELHEAYRKLCREIATRLGIPTTVDALQGLALLEEGTRLERIVAERADCPSWCRSATDAGPCHGEHLEPKLYVSATGGRPALGPDEETTVGVGLDFCERDGDDAPSVGLHVTGSSRDSDLLLRPDEAEALGVALLTAAGRLTDGRG